MRYSVGIGNVGSFQSSGRPWLKKFTLGAGVYQFVEFPKVTKSVKITNDILGAGNTLDVAFCEPRRAIDFTGTNEYLETTLASSVNQCTLSAWVKLVGLIDSKWYLEILGGNGIRVQTTATPRLRLRVGATNVDDTTTVLSAGPWINLTITVNGTENKLYLNGELLVTNTADAGTGFTGVALGGDGATGYDGYYDESVFFNTMFTAAEVSELYNAGAAMLPREHSKFSNLVSHWQFEDNNFKTFNSTPDTTSLIYDRISSNNLALTGGATALTFVNGRLIENAFDRHKITLGAQSLDINCKLKQIMIRANGALELSMAASLTQIPIENMFLLTGEGIDV